MTNRAKRVTFWAVAYGVWGADYKGRAWFDSKERAWAFYDNTDVCDRPQARSVSKPETIEWYRNAVSRTESEHGMLVDKWLSESGENDDD